MLQEQLYKHDNKNELLSALEKEQAPTTEE